MRKDLKHLGISESDWYGLTRTEWIVGGGRVLLSVSSNS